MSNVIRISPRTEEIHAAYDKVEAAFKENKLTPEEIGEMVLLILLNLYLVDPTVGQMETVLPDGGPVIGWYVDPEGVQRLTEEDRIQFLSNANDNKGGGKKPSGPTAA